MMHRRSLLAALAAPSLFAAAHAAGAEEPWPARPIRLVHGFSPGGGTDATARIVAEALGRVLGQPVVVEGRPGASTTIAAATVARAAPDGYTLFMMSSSHAIAPNLVPRLPFDPLDDFTMVARVAVSPTAIVVSAGSPVRSVRDLAALARTRPGGLNYSGGAIGTIMHLGAVLLGQRLGMEMTNVPYRGNGEARAALLAGDIDAQFSTLSDIDADNASVRILAVATSARMAQLPGVPTVSEAIGSEFNVEVWYSLAGPPRLPGPMVDRLSTAIRVAMGDDQVGRRLRAANIEIAVSTPGEARALLVADLSRWSKLVRENGLRLE